MISTTSTIRISKRTLRLLDELKEKFGAKSYEDVILKLILEYRRRIIEEYFGVDRDRITEFSEEDRGEDREY
ncbi:MAG: VapB-type antitoxin [Thermoprotei archaeon]|nr:VapB-type antitoxin [Thermoprotei archaeon]